MLLRSPFQCPRFLGVRLAAVVVVVGTGALVLVTDAQMDLVSVRVLYFSENNTGQCMPVTR